MLLVCIQPFQLTWRLPAVFVYVQVSADWTVSPAQRQWHYADDWSSILHTTGCIADEEWCHWGGPGQGMWRALRFCPGIIKKADFVSHKAPHRKHARVYTIQSRSGWVGLGWVGLEPQKGALVSLEGSRMHTGCCMVYCRLCSLVLNLVSPCQSVNVWNTQPSPLIFSSFVPQLPLYLQNSVYIHQAKVAFVGVFISNCKWCFLLLNLSDVQQVSQDVSNIGLWD